MGAKLVEQMLRKAVVKVNHLLLTTLMDHPLAVYVDEQ
jgi:hypothetical protein